MAEHFIFEGFQPTHDLEAFAKDLMWKLEAGAPSRAAQTGSISKQGNAYLGHLKVSSQTGVFSAKLEGEDPQTLLKRLFEKVTDELSDWKKARFKKD